MKNLRNSLYIAGVLITLIGAFVFKLGCQSQQLIKLDELKLDQPIK